MFIFLKNLPLLQATSAEQAKVLFHFLDAPCPGAFIKEIRIKEFRLGRLAPELERVAKKIKQDEKEQQQKRAQRQKEKKQAKQQEEPQDQTPLNDLIDKHVEEEVRKREWEKKFTPQEASPE